MPNDQETGPSPIDLALAGLLSPRKALPPSLFYDDEGCRLFYEITKLPEYYLTRTEFALLGTVAPDAAAMLPSGTALVEYGASDETKAAMLLRHTAPDGAPVFQTYVPIDVAGPALHALRDRMATTHPDLTVVPVVADFMHPVALPARPEEPAILGFFPGSTIGNLEPAAAIAFLRRARDALGSRARFLLGFDTCRDPVRLIPAYDDAAGVTARFNLNLLTRLNREAGADFDPACFTHRAAWNAAESRIEMHLVSRVDQKTHIAGRTIAFASGETIHTENSYKYAPDRMRGMIEAAGWRVSKTWADPDALFAVWMLG